jgi:LAO/AO transport system kinase
MSGYVASTALLEGVAAGDPRAIGRMISRAEAGVAEARAALATIYHRAGAAHVIGITGVPGSGKSTLVARLARLLRERGERVGIVAIDPSSPYSGGAILGDRIRMSDVASDPGIYIRSMATRGATGGMARAALDACDILDVAGYRTIIIETVGVGQDEVEIARASDTTLVVSAPGLGDEIQAIKAGVLEIADIHVVSKCDRSDAQRTLTDLKNMLALGAATTARAEWRVPVVGTSSVSGEGFDELLGAIDAHRAASRDSELGRARRRRIAEFRLHKTAQTLLLESFERAATPVQAALAQRLARREGDPYSLARELVATSIRKEYPHESD